MSSYMYILCFFVVFIIIFFFFFSSRRRHTRWPRDWSSDVCSSDLTVVVIDDFIHFVFLNIGDNNGCSFFRKEDGFFSTHSTTSTCYNRYFLIESSHFISLP